MSKTKNQSKFEAKWRLSFKRLPNYMMPDVFEAALVIGIHEEMEMNYEG